MYEIFWNSFCELWMIALHAPATPSGVKLTRRGALQRFDELLRISCDCDAPSRVFQQEIRKRVYNSPVLSHVFKGITRREILHVIKCVLSAGCTCRGEACQQGFTAHVCAAPTAVSISLWREGVKQEAFCWLLKVFIKKC